MDIRTEWVELAVSDGTKMRAWVARPKDNSLHAGLLVFQEAFGVNPYMREVTERFAREGFFAICPELFHRTGPGVESNYKFEEVAPHMKALTDAGLEGDASAAYHYLLENGASARATSSVGFCLGGKVAFLSALTLPLAHAISFYGGGIAPREGSAGLLGRAADMKCPILLLWGGKDKHIPPEQVRQITDALRNAHKHFVNVEFSEADHGFFCDARPSYHPQSSRLAWPLTLAFLRSAANGNAKTSA